MKRKYIFSENNSGGRWWLKKADYEALFACGWMAPEPSRKIDELVAAASPLFGGDVPFGLRHGVYGFFESMREAVDSFEAATGKNFFEEGCNCCGAPFSLRTGDDLGDRESLSGDDVERREIRPW